MISLIICYYIYIFLNQGGIQQSRDEQHVIMFTLPITQFEIFHYMYVKIEHVHCRGVGPKVYMYIIMPSNVHDVPHFTVTSLDL